MEQDRLVTRQIGVETLLAATGLGGNSFAI
jgi:hypothetical protein